MPTTRTDTVTVDDGTFDLTVVLPASGAGPGILLLQEIFGVGEFLLGKAEDLAALGYVVACPDFFWRIERNVALAHDEAGLGKAFELMERYAAEVPPETEVADLCAALGHLRGLPSTAGEKVAAMGYCLGGRLAYELAAMGEPDACVSYYGSGIASLLDLAEKITCPILFHFGGDDPYIPMSEVEAIQKAFADRSDAEVHIQGGAGHAFENSFGGMFYDADAAARSWEITVDWLHRHLHQ